MLGESRLKFLHSRWAIVLAATIGLTAKLLLALKTFGTNDVYSYEEFAVWSKYLGVDLYHFDPLFNHPPSMIHVLQLMHWLASTTGVGFPFWLRLPAILADLANLWLVWKLLGERVRERSIHAAVVLLALSPTLILISGFHGNTDSVAMCFVLLSIFLLERDASPWFAGAALGLAHCVKVYPLIAGPVIFLNLRTWDRRVKFCIGGAIVLLLGWSPYLYQDPRAVIRQVFGYRSAYGMWGISYLLDQLTATLPALTPLNQAFERTGAYFALGLVCLASWKMYRAERRPPLVSQVGLAFLLFLSVSSGFGVQYLAWLAPWVVELGGLPAGLFYATSGVFLFLVYNLWAEGFPWYLADSNNLGTFLGYYDYAHLICWISLVILAWLSAGRMLGLPSIRSAWAWAGGAVASLFLLAAVPPQLPWPHPTGFKYDDTVRYMDARNDLELAGILADKRRYGDSLEVAQKALKLSPDWAADANRMIEADQAALHATR